MTVPELQQRLIGSAKDYAGLIEHAGCSAGCSHKSAALSCIAEQMQTFATFLEELPLPAKHDAPIHKLFEANNSGFNQAVNDCRRAITQAANELKGQDNG